MNLADIHTYLTSPDKELDLGGMTPADQTTPLPDRTNLRMSLADALRLRKSAYKYGPHPLATEDLATLLAWAAGPQRTVHEHILSMAPSAGALPSLDIYAVVRAVENVPAGVHHYNRTTGQLSALWSGDPTRALRSLLQQPEFADRVSIVLAVVARLDTTLVKYPVRHYRTLHVDAGVLTQNLYLVATALGLASCAVAGFSDSAVTELLQLPATAFPAMLFAVGPAI